MTKQKLVVIGAGMASGRLIELMKSMPSIPASESSSTFVTWLSTIFASAPR